MLLFLFILLYFIIYQQISYVQKLRIQADFKRLKSEGVGFSQCFLNNETRPIFHVTWLSRQPRDCRQVPCQMKRGQTHLFMQKQPYYLLACCRLVTNHLPKNWEMGFLGFVKCQFKQDIFFFHFVCQSFAMCFCKEFSRRNHQMSQEFGQKLKKRCILKKTIFFS